MIDSEHKCVKLLRKVLGYHSLFVLLLIIWCLHTQANLVISMRSTIENSGVIWTNQRLLQTGPVYEISINVIY